MFDVQAMAKNYKENGYVIFELLLSESERLAALCGFHRLFAPSYESWVEQGRPEIAHNTLERPTRRSQSMRHNPAVG